MRGLRLLAAGGLLGWGCLAGAEVRFEAWARASAPGASVGAVFGCLVNQGAQALVARELAGARAQRVEVHRAALVDGVMRMRQEALRLAPGEALLLQPGGLHIMLMELGGPLRQGSRRYLRIGWSDGSVGQYLFQVGALGQMRHPDEGPGACAAQRRE